MKNGVLAGFPMDSMKVTLLDGSFHPVDSDQLSFEICAIQAYKNACSKAGPVLMEPIMKLEVVTPEENMGDVIGDLNKRRGQVEGMEYREGNGSSGRNVWLCNSFAYHHFWSCYFIHDLRSPCSSIYLYCEGCA